MSIPVNPETDHVYDFPYLITRVTTLDKIFQDSNGQVSFWLPRSPDPNYVNVSGYIRHNTAGETPPGPTITVSSGTNGYPEFLFVLNDPTIALEAVNYGPMTWNSDGTGTPGPCTPFTRCNPTVGFILTEGSIWVPQSPNPAYVFLGMPIAPNKDNPPPPPFIGGPSLANFHVWAVNAKYATKTDPLTISPIFNLQNQTGSDDNTSVYYPPEGVYHTFYTTAINDPTGPPAIPMYQKLSVADAAACCTQDTKFFLDQNQTDQALIPQRCVQFFPPSTACDPVLIQVCSTEVYTDPINLKNPLCGCVLPPQFYAVSDLIGPVPCVAFSCTSQVNAYKLTTQLNPNCNIVNCVISQNSVSAVTIQNSNIDYVQVCCGGNTSTCPNGTVNLNSQTGILGFFGTTTGLIILIVVGVIALILFAVSFALQKPKPVVSTTSNITPLGVQRLSAIVSSTPPTSTSTVTTAASS